MSSKLKMQKSKSQLKIQNYLKTRVKQRRSLMSNTSIWRLATRDVKEEYQGGTLSSLAVGLRGVKRG